MSTESITSTPNASVQAAVSAADLASSTVKPDRLSHNVVDNLLHNAVLQHLGTPTEHIDAKYQEVADRLGAPTGDVSAAGDGGYVRTYQRGLILYRMDTGAHAVYGAIGAKFVQLGREGGLLGYPLTDELGTPDGVGRFNRFQRGMIYWTPATDAHEVHGAILALWESMGWEASWLGYPVSDELPSNDGRASNFQHGIIFWNATRGAIALTDVITLDSGPITFSDSTALGGWCRLVINRNGDVTFSGHMHDSGFDTYEFAVAAVALTPSGIGYTVSYSGRAEGTSAGLPFGTPRRDDDWTESGNNPPIRDNWIEAAQSVFKVRVVSQDKLAGGLSDVVQDALKDLAKQGIEAGVKALVALIFA